MLRRKLFRTAILNAIGQAQTELNWTATSVYHSTELLIT